MDIVCNFALVWRCSNKIQQIDTNRKIRKGRHLWYSFQATTPANSSSNRAATTKPATESGSQRSQKRSEMSLR